MRSGKIKLAVFILLLLGLILGAASWSLKAAEDGRAVRLKSKSGDSSSGLSRYALVIGNAAYAIGALRNSVNDARAMDKALRECGFSVILKTDATLQQMEEAVNEFKQSLNAGGVGLFYYAGHGIQVKGDNYLIPVDVDLNSEADVRYKCFNMGLAIAKLSEAKNPTNIVILDACRNNPFARGWGRGAESRGLAQVEAAEGMLVAFATSPGNVAADGAGQNGIYTANLLKKMKEPGLQAEIMFKKVREAVKAETGGEQVPWENTSLTGEFYFVPPQAAQASAGAAYEPVLPPKAGLDVSGYEKEAQKNKEAKEKERLAWADWQRKLESDVSRLKVMEQNPDISLSSKKSAWEKLLETYSADNPMSGEDEKLRQYAEGRVSALDGKIAEAERLAEEKRQAEDARKAEADRKAEERRQAEEERQAQAEARRQEAARKAASRPAASRPQQVAMGTLPSMITNAKDGSELINIPAGEFLMGSNDYDDEKPPHRVYLNAYYIGKYEVTNEQFAKFVNETGYNAGGSWKQYYNSGTADHPVVCVSWNDAKAYCNWANLRLPTEAEWEKAARGTDGRKYPWGNDWDASRCNFNSSGTKSVGSYSSGASPYGCLDMAGNVWEWCNDWYGEKYYSSSPQSNPEGPGSGSLRVLRGGSWINSDPINFRAAIRLWFYPVFRNNSLGFRVARSQ